MLLSVGIKVIWHIIVPRKIYILMWKHEEEPDQQKEDDDENFDYDHL